MQPALIITGTATSSSDAFSSTFVTFAMGKPSVNSLPGITIEVKTLGNTIPAPSPSLHNYAIIRHMIVGIVNRFLPILAHANV